MDFSTQVQFESPPEDVRAAIMDYVTRKYPRAADYITWDPSGSVATGSRMGASGTVRLSGDGPTIVDIKAKIGFPALLAVSESRIRKTLDQVVRDLKKSMA